MSIRLSGEEVIVDSLTIFGAAAVASMLVCYALERRGRGFVLAFAGACIASSVYGFLAGTRPFGVIEAVWAAVAARRWATTPAGTATVRARVP